MKTNIDSIVINGQMEFAEDTERPVSTWIWDLDSDLDELMEFVRVCCNKYDNGTKFRNFFGSQVEILHYEDTSHITVNITADPYNYYQWAHGLLIDDWLEEIIESLAGFIMAEQEALSSN